MKARLTDECHGYDPDAESPGKHADRGQEACPIDAAPSMQGHYTIVYSPDDEHESGKGYYVDRWWIHKASRLFRTRSDAQAWAAKNGCEREHPQQ